MGVMVRSLRARRVAAPWGLAVLRRLTDRGVNKGKTERVLVIPGRSSGQAVFVYTPTVLNATTVLYVLTLRSSLFYFGASIPGEVFQSQRKGGRVLDVRLRNIPLVKPSSMKGGTRSKSSASRISLNSRIASTSDAWLERKA